MHRKTKKFVPCSVGCPWCGKVSCNRDKNHKTMSGSPSHYWSCGSSQNGREPRQGPVCELECEIKKHRAEFHAELLLLIESIFVGCFTLADDDRSRKGWALIELKHQLKALADKYAPDNEGSHE